VVAERIRKRFESTELKCNGEAVVVTASIGIAGMDEPASNEILSPGALIDRADRALYSAKSRGRNRIETWDHALYECADGTISH